MARTVVIVAAQWVVPVAAIALARLWTPALLMLFWAVPLIAVAGDCSAFGSPIYDRIGFLWRNPIAMGCWAIGLIGLLVI